MQTIGSSGGDPKPNMLEKLIRLAIPAGLIWGGIKLFNAFAPTLIEFFNNFWTLALVGVPAAALVLYVMQNPTFIWMGYKTLCRKLTSFFIKMDPLSFMDRYVDLLREKRKGLQKSKTDLKAKKIEMERDIQALKKGIDEKMRISKAAMNTGDKETAEHQSSMASIDVGSVNLYTPILKKMTSNLEFLDKLDENWGRSIEKLSHTVEAKRKEFITLKTMAKALGAAEEFAKGDTEANRIYKESVIALEENVTKKLAFIEEFESNSKGVMKSMAVEKQMMSDEGLELLARYEATGTVFLTEDYSTFEMKIDPEKDLFSKINNNAKPGNYNTSKSTAGSNEFSDFLKK